MKTIEINKRIITILLSISMLAGILSAGWEQTYGGLYDETGHSLAISQRGYVVAGRTYSFMYYRPEFYVLEISSSGDIIWQNTYSEGYAYSIEKTDDDCYISAGYLRIPPETGVHHYLVKINRDGDSLWTGRYRDTHYQGFSRAIQTSDGGYIAVWYHEPDGGMDFYVVRTDSIGDTIWTKVLGDSLNDSANSIIESSEEEYIIVGTSSCDGCDVGLWKIDSLGDSIWTKFYGGPGNDYGYFIDTTADGHLVITGTTSIYTGGIMQDVYFLKINDDGDTLWTRKIGGEDESDIGRCVRPTSDGGYIIVGYTYSYGIGTPESSNVYLVKTDSEGYVEWEQTYGGPGEDKGYSVSQTDDGGYIIAGVYDQGAHTDVYLIKTDSLGYVDWIREPGMKPEEISLNVYPNPFNSSCQITVDVGAFRETPLQIEIFDLRGNLVGALNLTPLQNNTAIWQPDEEIGSGIYLVRAKVGEKTTMKKIVFLR